MSGSIYCKESPYYAALLVFCNYRLLNHIAEINHSSKSDELWRFLESVYNSSVPDPSRTLQVPFNNGRDVCTLFLFSLYVKHKLGPLHAICATLESFNKFQIAESCKQNILTSHSQGNRALMPRGERSEGEAICLS
jgi:hypothetical protein